VQPRAGSVELQRVGDRRPLPSWPELSPNPWCRKPCLMRLKLQPPACLECPCARLASLFCGIEGSYGTCLVWCHLPSYSVTGSVIIWPGHLPRADRVLLPLGARAAPVPEHGLSAEDRLPRYPAVAGVLALPPQLPMVGSQTTSAGGEPGGGKAPAENSTRRTSGSAPCETPGSSRSGLSYSAPECCPPGGRRGFFFLLIPALCRPAPWRGPFSHPRRVIHNRLDAKLLPWEFTRGAVSPATKAPPLVVVCVCLWLFSTPSHTLPRPWPTTDVSVPPARSRRGVVFYAVIRVI